MDQAVNENLTLDFKLTLQKERQTDGRYVPPDGITETYTYIYPKTEPAFGSTSL